MHTFCNKAIHLSDGIGEGRALYILSLGNHSIDHIVTQFFLSDQECFPVQRMVLKLRKIASKLQNTYKFGR